jgi:hypothetical protein
MGLAIDFAGHGSLKVAFAECGSLEVTLAEGRRDVDDFGPIDASNNGKHAARRGRSCGTRQRASASYRG